MLCSCLIINFKNYIWVRNQTYWQNVQNVCDPTVWKNGRISLAEWPVRLPAGPFVARLDVFDVLCDQEWGLWPFWLWWEGVAGECGVGGVCGVSIPDSNIMLKFSGDQVVSVVVGAAGWLEIRGKGRDWAVGKLSDGELSQGLSLNWCEVWVGEGRLNVTWRLGVLGRSGALKGSLAAGSPVGIWLGAFKGDWCCFEGVIGGSGWAVGRGTY